MIDFEPTEEQQLIVDTVRQFAQNEIRPQARDANEAGKLPDGVLAHAHQLGLVANAVDDARHNTATTATYRVPPIYSKLRSWGHWCQPG